jgi:hypothetical protein
MLISESLKIGLKKFPNRPALSMDNPAKAQASRFLTKQKPSQ